MVTGRKLLLADDSVTIQKVIDLTFSDEGIEVTTVSNGEQAISMLEEMQPDIVLADIFMPGRSGYEVCEHIKRDERFRHIPVMLLVGSFEPFDEAEARRVGADDYLTKPFQSIRELVSKVTSLIGGGSSREEASTRDLELPQELADKEARRQDADADIHTADTAPLPRELADKEPAEAAAHLAGHESLDDEMIETHTADEIEQPRQTIITEARPTASLSADDLKEAEAEPPVESPRPAPLEETIRDFRMNEMKEDPLSTDTPSQTTTTRDYINNAAAADEALLDLGDIEPPMSTTEADDFILDLQDDSPPGAPFSQASAAAAAPAQSPRPEREASNAPALGFSQAVAGATPSPQFSEDFAPVIPESSEASTGFAEETAAPEAHGAEEPVSMLSTTGEENEAKAFTPHAVSYPVDADLSAPERGLDEEPSASSHEAAAMLEAAPRTGQITLDQLSPEAIDAIARRAVELLSAKAVEQIAWEVVPQLAELLIKRRLEEEKTE